MAQGHLSHHDFFLSLHDLFGAQCGKKHGSIYLTQKRITYGTAAAKELALDPLADLHPSTPLPVIVRATNGKSKAAKTKKVKLSTVVQPEDLQDFFVQYADVCKTGMQGLKKRDRRARKKDKSKKKKVPADAGSKT